MVGGLRNQKLSTMHDWCVVVDQKIIDITGKGIIKLAYPVNLSTASCQELSKDKVDCSVNFIIFTDVSSLYDNSNFLRMQEILATTIQTLASFKTHWPLSWHLGKK